MIISMCEQKSDEWLELRRGVITASASKDIFSPGMRATYVTKLLAEIFVPGANSFEANEFMQWGIDTEDKARQAYIDKTGNKVAECGFIFKNSEMRVGCSPDGMIGEDGLLEIKCPMTKTHLKYLKEGAPKDYIMQMQFQMYCSGREWCDFVSFDPRLPVGLQLLIQRIDKDTEIQMKIHACVKKTIEDTDLFLEEYNLKWEDLCPKNL